MSLEGCVASLSSSCATLQGTLRVFHAGIADFPRLHHVLSSTRHFELVAESGVLAAQRDLVAEIGPQREELLVRAQRIVTAEERREQKLKSQVALQKVRLQRPARTPVPTAPITGSTGEEEDVGVQAERAERLRVLKAKKARLQYQLKTISLEKVGRKTRMSLAPRSHIP